MKYYVDKQIRKAGTIKLHWIFANFKMTQAFGLTSFAKLHLHDIYIGLNGHEGVDFGFPSITPVRAAHDGVIVRDKDENVTAYGIHVCIWDQEQEIATYYCHLNRNTVCEGELVKAGQIIGFSGNTAGRASKSTGPHLHFGLCKTENGYRINKDNGMKGFIDPFGSDVLWIDRPAA